MSEQEPKTAKQPVLVPRNDTGRIETWHRTGETNSAGRELVEGQFEETINGETGIPKKWVKPEALETEQQAELAEELAATLGKESLKNEVAIPGLEDMMSGKPQEQDNEAKGGRFGNGVVTLKPGEFKGNPQKAIGHPSNPTTGIDFSKKV